jgi:hypothetical protein
MIRKAVPAAILAFAALFESACIAAPGAAVERHRSPQPAEAMAMSEDHPFEMSDEEFWTNPEKNLSELAGHRVLSEIAGIVADSPKTIVLSQRQKWPYLVLQTGDTEALYKVPFAEHAIVTAYSPTEDVLYAARAVPRMGPKKPPRPMPSPGFSSSSRNIDVRAALGMPWRSGRYILTAVVRDQTSNRVSVDLVSSIAAYDDQEVQKFLAAREAQQPPRAVSPPLNDARVSYERTRTSVELPVDPAVSLRAARVVEALPDAKALLQGSFRLPVRPSDVISKDAIGLAHPDITAVVPISLLVIGSEDAVPEVLRLVVPSFLPTSQRDGKSFATGFFSVDLAQMGSFMQRPQTYFIYAFANQFMTPAALMAIVPRQPR